MKNFAILSLAVLALAGCTTPGDRLARHQAMCSSYGLQPGTPAFSDCLVRLETADHGRGGLLNSGTR